MTPFLRTKWLGLSVVLLVCPCVMYGVEDSIFSVERSARPASSPPSRDPPEALLPGTARVAERIFGLPGLPNAGRVAPGILRGAQPGLEGYAVLKRMGVRTVINLRTRHDERTAVEAAGMRYLPIPMGTAGTVDNRAVRRAVDALRDPANQPVFLHCAHGADRTGVVVAVYRMEAEGWTNREAEAEMQAFGFHDVWRNLKEYVRRYSPGVGGAAGERRGR